MARSDNQQYRKTQRMLDETHGGNAGRSILQMLQEQLDAAAVRYLEKKAAAILTADTDVAVIRGEIRGLARAIALMQNPYHPTRGIKELERAAVAKAKEHRDAHQ